MKIAEIKGVKRYRQLTNRFRIYAIQYTGDNKKEIQEFIGMKILSNLDGSYIKCNGRLIEKYDHVIRKMIVTDSGNTADIDFEVLSNKEFQRIYRSNENVRKNYKKFRKEKEIRRESRYKKSNRVL